MHAKMRWVLTLLCCIVLLPSLSHGMTREQKNLVGGELGGRGVFFTVNYERYLTDMFGAGAGVLGFSTSDGAVFVLPLYASATIGETHALYLSAGVTIFGGASWDNPGKDSASKSTATVAMGYQFLAKSGFYVRPLFTYMPEFSIVWPGISIGGSF